LRSTFFAILLGAVLALGVLASGTAPTLGQEPRDGSEHPPDPPDRDRRILTSEQPPITGTICDVPGIRAKGGDSVRLLGVRLDLPPGTVDYVVSPVLSETEGTLIGVCLVQLNSAVVIRVADIKEVRRSVGQVPAEEAIDAVVQNARKER